MSLEYATLTAVKCPKPELTTLNKAIVGVNGISDFRDRFESYVAVRNDNREEFIFAVHRDKSIPDKQIAFTLAQRKWASLLIDCPVTVSTIRPDLRNEKLMSLELEVDFLTTNQASNDPCDTEELYRQFSDNFNGLPLAVNQLLVFLVDLKVKKYLSINVKKIHVLGPKGESRESKFGFIWEKTVVTFDPKPGSNINLVGKYTGKAGAHFTSIISPDWDFSKMGIGGLDKEFSDIFRRAFASRVFPPHLIEQLGLKHARGILLYGPPGTGKTLIARQIGKMLHAREPKIVNGPSILDKYVGESEANIRKLFAEAEEESKKAGMNSALHIIIFDEIDAICKARGSVGSGTAVHDTVVNQLLSKMDGVDQLNNILVIGMTNRRDMIDEALLRPGRMEVQMEIGLPDEEGRQQILKIHTSKLRENRKLGGDVDINDLASRTKNFSGAELEGLCRAAAFTALNEKIKFDNTVEVDRDAFENVMVKREHFDHALAHDVKPAFGKEEEILEKYIEHGIIYWSSDVDSVLEVGDQIVKATAAADSESSRFALLLHGASNVGKTALAVHIARKSGFPFVKMCTAANMVGFTESAKCATINKVFMDAHKSQFSVIILDSIEGLIDYNPVGPRYSNMVTQALIHLITKPVPTGKHLLIIGTTSNRQALQELTLANKFTSAQEYVHSITEIAHVERVLAGIQDVFTQAEHQDLKNRLRGHRMSIGIKQLIDMLKIIRPMDEGRRAEALVSRLYAVGAIDIE